jgi:hypothetical protein
LHLVGILFPLLFYLPFVNKKTLFCVDKVICCVSRLHNDMVLNPTKKERESETVYSFAYLFHKKLTS